MITLSNSKCLESQICRIVLQGHCSPLTGHSAEYKELRVHSSGQSSPSALKVRAVAGEESWGMLTFRQGVAAVRIRSQQLWLSVLEQDSQSPTSDGKGPHSCQRSDVQLMSAEEKPLSFGLVAICMLLPSQRMHTRPWAYTGSSSWALMTIK